MYTNVDYVKHTLHMSGLMKCIENALTYAVVAVLFLVRIVDII